LANIQEISKKALYKLEKDNQPIIPSNYFMEFKNQAQLAKVDIDDIKIFNKINERLTPDERCLIKVNSFKDLATILVERTTTEELKSLIEVLNELLAPSADFSVIEELQKELEHVKEEQQIDFLTNILNRRGYHCEMEKMEKKFAMFNGDYAVIFFDIDHFKQINDVYGHNCGDAVLRNFALILKDLTRKEDVLARYGGEEFIALINYHEEIEIQRYIKRVRKAISNTNFRYKDTDIKVNFSAGVSHRRKYDSFSEAKKRADELLYEAKHNGRDKIIFDSGIVL
jgi:diguanylate cyclase (GGDEF)-like protein